MSRLFSISWDHDGHVSIHGADDAVVASTRTPQANGPGPLDVTFTSAAILKTGRGGVIDSIEVLGRPRGGRAVHNEVVLRYIVK